MAGYLITGDPGSGKSAVAAELRRRGYAAYDTDELPDVTRLEDHDGRPVPWPGEPIDWSRYSWNWQQAGLRTLLASAGTVFVAAVVSNQEAYYHLFDAIVVLTVDAGTLRRRLMTRTSSDYGKHPDELAGILACHVQRERDLLGVPRAVAVDATRPLDQVAADVLAAARATPPVPRQ